MRNSDAYVAVVGPDGGVATRLMPGIRAWFAPPAHLIVIGSDGNIVAVPFDARRRRITGTPLVIASGLHTGAFSNIGSSAVSATGRLVYLSSGWGKADAPSHIVWVGRGGVVVPLDSSWIEAFQSVALSPDGQRVAVGVYRDGGEELLVRDLANGSQARVAIPGTQLRSPVFSPDGRSIYFVGLGASHGIHRVDPGGAAVPKRVVVTGFTYIGDPTLTPDGGQLYFARSAPDASTRIVRSSMAGPIDDIITPPAGALASHPQVSPDGRWLAFLSLTSDGAEIHVRSTDTTRTADWRVAAAVNQGTSIRWSRAGNQLFYVAHDSMMTVSVRTSPSFSLGVPLALFGTSRLKPVFDLGPDGRFLMIRTRPDLRPPTVLMMLEHWPDLLPQ